MKKTLLYTLIFFGVQFSKAQINELGLMIGGVNPIADVGGDFYVSPNRLAYGVLYRWNAHERFSLRAQVNIISLYGDDANSKNHARKERDFSFKDNLFEFSGGVEYYFSEFDMKHYLSRDISPYIYLGVAYFLNQDLHLYEKESEIYNRKGGTKGVIAIPFGLGVKAKVSSRFLVSLEVGARYTFTKNLDGSYEGTKIGGFETFGNKNSNDWYTVIGVMLTYTFGEYPCYCW